MRWEMEYAIIVAQLTNDVRFDVYWDKHNDHLVTGVAVKATAATVATRQFNIHFSVRASILKCLWSTRRPDSLNYEKFFFCSIPSTSYLSCYLKLFEIKYPEHGLSLFSMHTLSWIPFDLQACLLCYANKAASAIGSTTSTSRFRFSAFLLSEYFLFKRTSGNATKSGVRHYRRATDEW